MPSASLKSKMSRYIQETEVVEKLQVLLEDETFRTLPGHSIDTELYPDYKIPFIQGHLNYLKKHPQVDPEHYLSNLRLMLKIR